MLISLLSRAKGWSCLSACRNLRLFSRIQGLCQNVFQLQPERGSAFGRALVEGQAVHIPDVQADPEYTY